MPSLSRSSDVVLSRRDEQLRPASSVYFVVCTGSPFGGRERREAECRARRRACFSIGWMRQLEPHRAALALDALRCSSVSMRPPIARQLLEDGDAMPALRETMGAIEAGDPAADDGNR